MSESDEPRDFEPSDPSSGDPEPQDSATPGPEQSASAAHPPRRPRFRAATDAELDANSYMVADQRAAARSLLHSRSISSESGDSEVVGGVMRRLGRVLKEAAVRQAEQAAQGLVEAVRLKRLAWTASVLFEFEVSAGEQVQRSLDGSRHSPSIDAARDLMLLMGAEPDMLIERALGLGTEATQQYMRLLKLLSEEHATLELQVPDSEVVATLDHAEALHDYAILDREGERGSDRIRVLGTLTMADSRRQQFELTLDMAAPRPSVLGRRRLIDGTFEHDVAEKLRAEGLWDARVIASIEVTFTLPGTAAIPKEPEFRLLDAETVPRAGDPRPLF